MNALLWVVATIVSIPLLAILIIGYLRALGPHSRRMTREQMQLNKKTGGENGSYTVATESGSYKLTWFKSHLWSILLIGIGAAVFFWGLYTPRLHLADVGNWSWDHWISLPSFFGIVIALIVMHVKKESVKKTLYEALAFVAFMLFIGFPTLLWVRDAFLPTIICKNIGANETGSCILNTAWSTWIKPGPGKEICYSPAHMVSYEYENANGNSFYRFRAKEGRVVLTYGLEKLNAEACTKSPQ